MSLYTFRWDDKNAERFCKIQNGEEIYTYGIQCIKITKEQIELLLKGNMLYSSVEDEYCVVIKLEK